MAPRSEAYLDNNGGAGHRGAWWLAAPMVPDLALLLFRLWFGAMMIYHGYGKVFGGIGRFTQGVAKMGFPAPEFFAWAAALSEFAGGILIILGLGSRIVSVMAAITMGVAAFIRHADDPFKSKELAITYLILAVVLFLLGPGRHSIDAMLARRRRS